uniref:Portal protein n=1 Tax=viral metagenome TaxID=1070528 RepID=A0A6M3JZU3_9ZZZZ
MASKKRIKETDSVLAQNVYDQYDIARREQQSNDAEFDGIMDMIECKRSEKDYEWMSDVFIPEYPSIHLTEASQWANQYFQSRDFVEVYLSSTSDIAEAKAKASKDYINTMLNVKELYHYGKYMRARSINSIRGQVVAVCSWKQRLLNDTVRSEAIEQTGLDMNGQPIYGRVTKENNVTHPIEDRFEYEVVDPRNLFTDNKYAYSIQEKEWITIRSEMTYDELYARREENGYINLDKLKEWERVYVTETAKVTGTEEQESKLTHPHFDILERFGKTWATVTSRDEYENPVLIQNGYKDDGSVKDSAELVEAIVTVACYNGQKVLIRFQATPFITSKGVPYRPLIRGLCYIHPTKDAGMSDGKYGRELQVLINDMVNMGIDRSKLSMLPTLKVRRLAWEDNDSIYFEPEHAMIVENKDDIEEFRIDGNIEPAMSVVSLAISKMQQVQAVYPTTMGNMPGKVETATAISGAENRGNLRANYKSLTFEHTFLAEFYWMMLQMGYQFMHPETAMQIMGENAQNFDPDQNYSYTPVTSNIEVEYSKAKKLQAFDGMLSRIVGIQNPAVVPIIAAIISRQFELLGDEYQKYSKLVDALAKTPNTPESGAPPQQENGREAMQPSNQEGIPMSGMEESTRGLV